MEKITLEKELDIIDFVAENIEEYQGRKIYTNLTMVKRVCKLTDQVKTEGDTTVLTIVCPETGNLTVVEFVKEGTNYWLKSVTADDITPFEPIDPSKQPIYVVNEKVCSLDK